MVAPRRRWAASLLLSCVCVLVVGGGTGVALAQEASSEPAKSWGEKAPPDGHVQSKGPKKQGESTYKWKQMGYASIVILAMAGVIVLLVRRNTRES